MVVAFRNVSLCEWRARGYAQIREATYIHTMMILLGEEVYPEELMETAVLMRVAESVHNAVQFHV